MCFEFRFQHFSTFDKKNKHFIKHITKFLLNIKF